MTQDELLGGGEVSSREDAVKLGASGYAQYYGDIRRLLSTEFAAEVRWLTASLFALNAGGLVTLAGKSALNASQRYAGFGFWLGILFAFIFVLYSQHKTKEFLNIVQQMENCWVLAFATGDIDTEQLSELERAIKGSKAKLGDVFSVASFSMFSVAIYLLVN